MNNSINFNTHTNLLVNSLLEYAYTTSSCYFHVNESENFIRENESKVLRLIKFYHCFFVFYITHPSSNFILEERLEY